MPTWSGDVCCPSLRVTGRLSTPRALRSSVRRGAVNEIRSTVGRPRKSPVEHDDGALGFEERSDRADGAVKDRPRNSIDRDSRL